MSQQGPHLRRQLGIVDATAISLGAIIGAGIFVALGQAAGAAGATLPLAVVVAGIVATLNGLSAVELGVNDPRAGGPYEFGYQLLSPLAGFVGGWVYLVANLAATAAFTLAFADYLQPLTPGVPLRALAVALALLVLGVNLAGVEQSRRLNNLLVAFKVAVLVVFVLVGLAFIQQWNPQAFLGVQLARLPRASALVFFAFAGFARNVTLAGEIRDPARTLPVSMVASLAISGVLYLAVAVVGLGLVGASGLAGSVAPLRTALGPTGAVWAQVLVSVGALVATSDVLLTTIWSVSRVMFAMARRGDFPAILSRLDARGVPRPAVLLTGAIIVPLTATVTFGLALSAASLGQLVYYSVMDASALRLPPARRLYAAVIPLAGLLLCAALALSLPLEAALVLGGAVAVGLIYYALWHR